MPSVVCSSCSKKYRIDDSAAGKKFACKQCGTVIRVPAVAAAPVPVAAAKPKPAPPPVVKKRSAPPVPPPIELQEEENTSGELDFADMASLESTGEVDNSLPVMDETPVPAYRGTRAASKPKAAKKSWTPPRIGFRLNRGVLIVIGLGIAAIVWGGREWMLASSASDSAQDITCADLGQNGPGDNAHVRVTNFYATSGYVAWQTDKGDLQTIWYPIIPPNSFKIPEGKKLKEGSRIVPDSIIDSSNIHVLIKTHAAKSQGDVEGTMDRDTLEGMVINKIDSLKQNELDLLHQKYPALSQENCYIVEDGRKPQGGLGMFAVIGGLVLAVFGLFLMFKPST